MLSRDISVNGNHNDSFYTTSNNHWKTTSSLHAWYPVHRLLHASKYMLQKLANSDIRSGSMTLCSTGTEISYSLKLERWRDAFRARWGIGSSEWWAGNGSVKKYGCNRASQAPILCKIIVMSEHLLKLWNYRGDKIWNKYRSNVWSWFLFTRVQWSMDYLTLWTERKCVTVKSSHGLSEISR